MDDRLNKLKRLLESTLSAISGRLVYDEAEHEGCINSMFIVGPLDEIDGSCTIRVPIRTIDGSFKYKHTLVFEMDNQKYAALCELCDMIRNLYFFLHRL